MDTDTCGAITEFLRKVRHIFGGNCGYLLNESNQGLFKDLQRENDNRYYDPSRVIFEAYAKANNKPKLLEDKEHKLSNAEIKEFEEWLNSNRPTFDEGMFKSIMGSLGEKNEPVIKLKENNGQIVSLNETSAGRRWYFTYYFFFQFKSVNGSKSYEKYELLNDSDSKTFIIQQCMASVFLCKSFDLLIFVFAQASPQIVCYTDVHYGIGFVSEYVNVVH